MAVDDPDNPTIATLRAILLSETAPLARRFRALFSLKHLATCAPPTRESLAAVAAIAAALTPSASALLKHELAYCLGQTGSRAAAAPHLRRLLADRDEDAMCRHEAAEALGALGDVGSLEMLKERRDDGAEPDVVRETCEIAVERICWDMDVEGRRTEALKTRFVRSIWRACPADRSIVHSPPWTRHLRCRPPSRAPLNSWG
jgi:deoxyhypusine monooxygenase